MKIFADYHTHSKNSRFFHGKNSILEMAISANEMGLNEIGITDHGYKHLFRTNKAKIIKARKEIDEINSWSKTKVLLGVEADIIAEDGTIDVDNETLAMLDLLIVGYHKMIKTDFAGYFGNTKKDEESKIRCTNAFVNCINRYPVTIVSHLDSVLKTDLYRIGCACRDRNVMVEINNRHTKWTKEQVDELVASGCLFIVSSDAHRREDVGKVDHALDIIKKYDIPSEYIVNVEFDNNEKTEEHKEADALYSMYREKKYEKLSKEYEELKKKEYEFTESLSPEMEKALSEIAKEKGLNYHKKEEKPEEKEKGFLESVNFVDDTDIIERAKAYIEQNEMQEIESENDQINSVQAGEENAEQKVEGNNENIVNENSAVQANVQETKEVKSVVQQKPSFVKQPNNFVSGAIAELEKEDEIPQSVDHSQEVQSVQENPMRSSQVVPKTYKNTQKMDVVLNQPKKTKPTASSFNPLGMMSTEKIQEQEEKLEPETVQKTAVQPKKKRTGGFVGAGITSTIEQNKKDS